MVDAKSSVAAVTQNEVRVVCVPAPRGQIVDRNDTVLAGVGGAPVESSRPPAAASGSISSVLSVVAQAVACDGVPAAHWFVGPATRHFEPSPHGFVVAL